jgi:hypothetical protein
VITASKSTGTDAGWDAFVTQPALYIEPSRLAVCFDGMVDSELCTRLKSSLRLEERLSGLVHSRYGLARTIAPEDVSDTDRSIALASSEQLAEVVRRAGAIYWANSIANTIRAADAAAEATEDLDAFLTGWAAYMKIRDRGTADSRTAATLLLCSILSTIETDTDPPDEDTERLWPLAVWIEQRLGVVGEAFATMAK